MINVLALLEKMILSALKVKCFQPDFAIFFANGENAIKSKETSGNADYFKHVKICIITFGIL